METADPIRLWNWSGAGESLRSSAEGGYRKLSIARKRVKWSPKMHKRRDWKRCSGWIHKIKGVSGDGDGKEESCSSEKSNG